MHGTIVEHIKLRRPISDCSFRDLSYIEIRVLSFYRHEVCHYFVCTSISAKGNTVVGPTVNSKVLKLQGKNWWTLGAALKTQVNYSICI